MEPDSPRWHELVTLVIETDLNAAWIIGDAVLEVAPIGENGVHTNVNSILHQFADAASMSFERLRQYRRVAATWPAGKRLPAVPWSVHLLIMGHPEYWHLLHPGITYREIRQLLQELKKPVASIHHKDEPPVNEPDNSIHDSGIENGKLSNVRAELMTEITNRITTQPIEWLNGIATDKMTDDERVAVCRAIMETFRCIIEPLNLIVLYNIRVKP